MPKRKLRNKGFKNGRKNNIDDIKTSNIDTPKELSADVTKKAKLEPHQSPNIKNINNNILEYLLDPFDVSEFLESYWEKKPLIIKRQNNIPKSFEFSKSILEELIPKEDIRFGRDIHACRCVNGVTEDQHSNKSTKVTLKEFKRLFEKVGATIQFHQPQRFLDNLWELMEKLENYFSCLVGANTYITPIGTQGLAPHYDDVEVFIIQLEGEKHWKLYNAPVVHAREYKSNLTPETIGKPTHDFILKPGDLLYMPRGTVHEANSPVTCKSHSTHITISTYQKHCWGDYLLSSFPEILDMAMTNSELFRKGLPIGSLFSPQKPEEYFSQLMREIPNVMKTKDLPSSRSLIEDFMLSRLPPYGISADIMDESPDGLPPNIDSSIKLSYPKHVMFCVGQIVDDEESDEEDNLNIPTSDKLLVYSSLFNDRRNHMIASKDAIDQGTGTMKFPVSYQKAIQQLIDAGNSFITVKNLPLELDSDKIQFAMALWAQHSLMVDK